MNTFESQGHTWIKHTPGDDIPCRKEDVVFILIREEWFSSCFPDTPAMPAKHWRWDEIWDNRDDEIVGWRYAEQKAEPSEPSAEEMLSETTIQQLALAEARRLIIARYEQIESWPTDNVPGDALEHRLGITEGLRQARRIIGGMWDDLPIKGKSHTPMNDAMKEGEV